MKIVTFGELMLRLAPHGYLRFLQAGDFQATFGGAEANVAVSLTNYGIDASFVTKVPPNDIGQLCVNSLRTLGVNTSNIVKGGKRLGIFYIEKGASQRGSKVIYDRENTAISTADSADFDWNKILDGVSWFHWTGITPALSDNLALILKEALIQCKDRNITVSCDINYRNNLWSKAKARETMTELMQFVDVCIANEEDAYDVFGIEADGADVLAGDVSERAYRSVAKKIADKFNFKYVAITLRGSISANDNSWAGLIYDTKDYYFSKTYNIHIVDRVGAGDSFGAGLIYSLVSGFDAQKAIDFAVAASCLKQTIEGDYNLVSIEEVNRLVNGNASGRVQR